MQPLDVPPAPAAGATPRRRAHCPAVSTLVPTMIAIQPAIRATAVACAVLVSTAPLGAQAFPDDDAIQSILSQRIEQGRGVGLVVGVLEANGSARVVVAGSAGEGARSLSDRTLFEIGSVTKTFTGALLAEMARRGEVSLDDPVARYLPASVRMPTRNGRHITLLDLATHRSGLPALPTNFAPADPGNPFADYTEQQMYDFLSSHELERDIGSQVEYSDFAMGLLGHALARAAGSSYEQALRTRILEPLGMRDVVIGLDGEAGAWMARAHDEAGVEVSLWDGPALAGAGALRASVRDMLRWLAVNLGDAEPALATALRTAHEPREPLLVGQGPVDLHVGLGWITRSKADSHIVWHNGGTGGFFSFLGFDPARRVGVVVLSNAHHPVDDIGLHLLDASNPLAMPGGRQDP